MKKNGIFWGRRVGNSAKREAAVLSLSVKLKNRAFIKLKSKRCPRQHEFSARDTFL